MAADAVEIEIRPYCVENGFTHVVYGRLTTPCVLCLFFLFLLVLHLHEKHLVAFPGTYPSNFANEYFYTLPLGSICLLLQGLNWILLCPLLSNVFVCYLLNCLINKYTSKCVCHPQLYRHSPILHMLKNFQMFHRYVLHLILVHCILVGILHSLSYANIHGITDFIIDGASSYPPSKPWFGQTVFLSYLCSSSRDMKSQLLFLSTFWYSLKSWNILVQTSFLRTCPNCSSVKLFWRSTNLIWVSCSFWLPSEWFVSIQE